IPVPQRRLAPGRGLNQQRPDAVAALGDHQLRGREALRRELAVALEVVPRGGRLAAARRELAGIGASQPATDLEEPLVEGTPGVAPGVAAELRRQAPRRDFSCQREGGALARLVAELIRRDQQAPGFG